MMIEATLDRLPAYARAAAARYRLERARHGALGGVALPPLYPLQAEIATDPASRKVIASGRRSGKTFLAAHMAVERFLTRQQRVLLSSTSQEQADVFWRYIRRWLRPLIASGGVYKNETRRVLQLGDAEIRVKTGSDADALRGDNVSLLVLDECARLDPAAWYEVGAPMLADTQGDAVFISTPNRRNWFFNLFVEAQGRPGWRAWTFPTSANPYIAPDALALLAADMTEDAYRQEILAEFLESSGAVFRRINEVCTLARPAPYAGHFVAGLDWAMQRDYTVIVVIDVQRRQMVDMDRFHGVDWALQRGRVRAMADRWGLQVICAESNSIGSPNIEALQREGLPVAPFETTAVSKPPLIESLALAFERHELLCLDDPVLKGELMAYERKVTPSGRSQYSAPPDGHDDTVMALALAWYAVMQYGYIGSVPNPLYR